MMMWIIIIILIIIIIVVMVTKGLGKTAKWPTSVQGDICISSCMATFILGILPISAFSLTAGIGGKTLWSIRSFSILSFP